ncbi:MAG: hypothetical protein ACR2P9_01300 [Gammaproteobacteria bacterium]
MTNDPEKNSSSREEALDNHMKEGREVEKQLREKAAKLQGFADDLGGFDALDRFAESKQIPDEVRRLADGIFDKFMAELEQVDEADVSAGAAKKGKGRRKNMKRV